MLIEALKPLKIILPKGEYNLDPGNPIDVPETTALKLLAKAGGNAKSLHNRAEPIEQAIRPGQWVSWFSPLFGPCTGQVALAPENGWFVIRSHSVTDDLALIHTEWHVQIHTSS